MCMTRQLDLEQGFLHSHSFGFMNQYKFPFNLKINIKIAIFLFYQVKTLPKILSFTLTLISFLQRHI